MAAYAADKGRIYERVQRACVYNVADPVTEQLVREADVVEGARAIGFTLGMPARRDARRGRGHPGRPGLHRAARVQRRRAVHAGRPDDLGLGRRRTPSPNALAAAALARAHGVSQAAVRDGLRAFRPGGHRIAVVAERDGVTWVDDSKATNPHAAQASLLGLRPGGLGGRRARQGRDVRRPGPDRCATGCAASYCSVGTAT